MVKLNNFTSSRDDMKQLEKKGKEKKKMREMGKNLQYQKCSYGKAVICCLEREKLSSTGKLRYLVSGY